jgi:hypothetical protein
MVGHVDPVATLNVETIYVESTVTAISQEPVLAVVASG